MIIRKLLLKFAFFSLAIGKSIAVADNVGPQLESLILRLNSKLNTLETSNACSAAWPDCLTKLTPQNYKDLRIRDAISAKSKKLSREFQARGLELGAPVYLRTFKHPSVQIDSRSSLTATRQMDEKWQEGYLELWVLSPSGNYQFFKRYPICAVPGIPGPKRKEGDEVGAEGSYDIAALRMNPRSNYHASFNIGYPNEYDRASHPSGEVGAGKEIMMHGNCVTDGCMAMTDPAIEEIYAIVEVALNANQMPDGSEYKVPFDSYPFPLTDSNLNSLDPKDLKMLSHHLDSEDAAHFDVKGFWENLKQGQDYFDRHHQPAHVRVETTSGKPKYVFEAPILKPIKRSCK